MTRITALAGLLVVAGCQMTSKTDAQDAVENLTYFKDPKTGICFASIRSIAYGANQVVSIATVDCAKAGLVP